MCNTRSINHAVKNAATVVFHGLDLDVNSSLPAVKGKQIDNIHTMIATRFHSTGTDAAMAQLHNNSDGFEVFSLAYPLVELIDQPNNSFQGLSSTFAATEATMRFAAVLPMRQSAIASCSQPLHCSNTNNNSHNITSSANMTSIENTGLVNGSTIVEGAMLLRGME